MRPEKKYIDLQRRQQLWFTLVFIVLLITLMLVVSGCAPRRTEATFSKPKFEVSTHYTPKNGRASVRQHWHKRWWFWQRDRRQDQREP